MVPFNATLLLFGQTEMVGHLPVYGVFLALLVYGSSARDRPRRAVAAEPGVAARVAAPPAERVRA